MFVYSMVIYAANPNNPFVFTDELEAIFEETANACNNSTNFKRTGKTIEIMGFQKNCLTLELKSKISIESPTLSLRGFSRALIKTGKFNDNIYRSSLFNARQIDTKELEYIDDISIDDIIVVQKVVELFMSQSNKNVEVKNKIRQIITEL